MAGRTSPVRRRVCADTMLPAAVAGLATAGAALHLPVVFEYGTSTAYAWRTPLVSAGSGTTTVTVSSTVAGLVPDAASIRGRQSPPLVTIGRVLDTATQITSGIRAGETLVEPTASVSSTSRTTATTTVGGGFGGRGGFGGGG